MTDRRLCSKCVSTGHPLGKYLGVNLNYARKGGTECNTCQTYKRRKEKKAQNIERPTCVDCERNGGPLNNSGAPKNDARVDGADCNSCKNFKQRERERERARSRSNPTQDLS